MFDNVGKNQDAPGRAARSAVAGIGSVLGASAFVAALTLSSVTVLVVPPAAPPDKEPVLVELILEDVLEAPELPPLPARSGGGALSEVAPLTDVVVAPEVVAEAEEEQAPEVIVELKADPPKKFVSAIPNFRGKAGPYDPSQRNGTLGGDTKGEEAGRRRAEEVDRTVLELPEGALQAKYRPSPTYPPGESAKVTCRVTVELTARGLPMAVEIVGCPPSFSKATRQALMQWRWPDPPGQVAAFTTLAIHFVPVPKAEEAI